MRAGRRRARIAGFAALALLPALFAANLVRIAQDLDAYRPVDSGDAAPPFSLPRIGEGGEVGPEEVRLEDLRGRVVLVDFWATWCEPCREAMPVLDRLARAHGARGLRVISVNTEGAEKAGEARRIAARLAPRATLVSDDGRVADRYRVSTIPHLVLIDRRGIVRRVHRGFDGAEALEEELSDSLGELLE